MSTTQKPARSEVDPDAAPIAPLLILTFLLSIATAVMWNGLGFVAKHAYEYPEWLTFVLFAVNGGVYGISALGCGRVLRAIQTRVSPRTSLVAALLLQALVAPLMVLFEGAWALWLVSIIFSCCSAFLWTMVESYMGAGRYGRAMRSMIGWWNLTWMAANALGLAGMAFFLDAEMARLSVAILGPICLPAALCALYFRRSPAAHTDASGLELVGDNYAPMLGSCRIMLPISYILIGTLGPIMPYRLDDLAVDVAWGTPLTAIWLVARVLMVAAMSKMHFWHGRWSSLGLAGILMLLGFSLVTLGPGIESVLTGLALIGIGQGVTYYSAIYYVLALGRAKVEAAGTHEGLIGFGYGAGPAAGLVGIAFGGGPAIGWVVLAVVAGSAWPAVRPWWRARRQGFD